MREPEEIAAILARLQHPALPVIDLGLERVEALLARLGNPQLRMPPVIHVAGTNGKGSLISYLSAILHAANLRAHRYISPHLVRFHERIALAGREIGDSALLDVLTRTEQAMQDAPVTFFEATTAAAFLAFAEHPADMVLLETGLGGRLDATNVIPSPLLTAITPIALDHSEFLGDTLAKIAGEKAGIIKQGIPCVIGPQPMEALKVLEASARKKNAPLWRYGQEWRVEQQGGRHTYRSAYLTLTLQPSLEGEHQFANAATAAACIDALRHLPSLPGSMAEAQSRNRYDVIGRINDAAITCGIASAAWPARLQRLTSHPLAGLLPASCELWLDGGHNPHAGAMLAQWGRQRQLPLYLICGMIEGKDSAGFLAPFKGIAQRVYCVTIPEEPKTQSADVLALVAASTGMDACAASDMEHALHLIAAHAQGPALVLICGSLYLAGWVLAG